MDPTPLLILGAGAFASEVADLVAEIPGLRLDGFVQNLERGRGLESKEGLPVFFVDDIARFCATHLAVCAVGTTHRSGFIAQVSALGMGAAVVVHPTARVSGQSRVGEGSIVSVGSVIAAHTRIGRHVIVNRGALIGHHVTIGDYVSIGPGVNIGGSCHIGEATYVGIGATILDDLTIGAHSVVGGGAVVTRDVPDHVLVVGVPARVVKEGIPGK
jgi:sugar O-acyltransferase (sialic acid O-acetyltransferase NeuD family)